MKRPMMDDESMEDDHEFRGEREPSIAQAADRVRRMRKSALHGMHRAVHGKALRDDVIEEKRPMPRPSAAARDATRAVLRGKGEVPGRTAGALLDDYEPETDAEMDAMYGPMGDARGRLRPTDPAIAADLAARRQKKGKGGR